MKTGLMYGFTHGPHDYRAAARAYGELMDQIAMADGLGYDDLWLSEHHFTVTGYQPAPLVMAGAAAMRTRRIGIGIGVAAIPFHNPVRLAEACAVVDNLSGGRMQLGVGIGYRAGEFSGFGVAMRRRGAMLEEAVEVIRRCWSHETFSHHGEHYRFTEINCTPKPIQNRIPIWISGGAPAAIERAARLGDGWFAIGLSPDQLQQYRDASAMHGRNRPVAALPLPWIIVSEDPERDRAILRPHIFAELQLFTRWLASGGLFPAEAIPAHAEQAEALGLVTIGTAEDVIAKITAAYAAAPVDRWVFIPNIAGAPIEIANRSLELFAREVMPVVATLSPEALSR
jgi:probable F420-dependent oxidoreductase